MACKVNRNNDNKITRVNDSNGVESPVFIKIASHPLISDTEVALNIYKNTQLEKIGEDAQWLHRVNDLYTPDYKEALLQAENGQEIEVGFVNSKGDFFKILSTNKDTNRDTFTGFINSQIESGILSPVKIEVGTEYRFEAAGNNEIDHAIKTEILKQDAQTYLGRDGVKIDEDTFIFEKTKGTVKLETKDGTVERVKYDQLDEMTYEQMKVKFNDPELVYLDTQLYKLQPAYRDTKFDNNVPTRTEKELQISLLNLLSKLGVKTLSISEYVSKYEARNGVAPNAKALADIANQVIAYTEGSITLEDLTEETSHFIVEALPTEDTKNVLRNIDKTEEWAQFSDLYREVYRSEYQGEELENAVRREILGKVVANSIKSNFSTENKTETQSNIISKIREFIDSFFNTIRNAFRPQYKNELDAYLEDINKIINSEDTTNLSTDNFKHNKYRLYSVKNQPQLNTSVKKTIIGLEQQVKALSKVSATTNIDRNRLKKAEEALAGAQSLVAVSEVVGMAKSGIEYLTNAIEDSEKNNRSYIFTAEENTVYHSIKGLIGGALTEMNVLTTKKALRESGILGYQESYNSWGNVNKEIKETLEKLNKLEGTVSTKSQQNIERIVDGIVDKYNFSDETRQNLLTWAKTADSDTNYMHATFGQLAHAKDGMLRTAGYLLRNMRNNAHVDYTLSTQKLQKELRDLGFDEKFFKDVMLDGNQILNEFNLPELNLLLDQIYADVYRKETGSTLTDEQIMDRKSKGKLEFKDTEEETRVVQTNRTEVQNLRERPMKDSYYREYEKTLDEANLSEITKTRLKDYTSGTSAIKRKAQSKNGTLDYSKLSKADREKLREITEARYSDKNIFDSTGKLKKGLKYVMDSDGTIAIDDFNRPQVELDTNGQISNEARIAYDINNLDKVFAEKNKDKNNLKGIPIKFLSMLSKVEQDQGRSQAYDFLLSNAYIAMSPKFWEELDVDGNATLLEKLRTEDIDLYNDIVEQRSIIKNLLKQNKRKNQPIEVDGAMMSQTARDTIKNAQQTLEVLYADARALLPKEEEEENTPRTIIPQQANESYISELNSLNIITTGAEMDFAKNHMTEANIVKTNRDLVNIDGFETGNKNLSDSLQEQYDQLPDVDQTERITLLRKKVIRDRLLPYYKSYTPSQYKRFFEDLKDPLKPSIEELITEKDEMVEISPNYSFFDETNNDDVNPNYNPDFEGGFFQPKKGDIKYNGKTYNFENQKYKDMASDPKKLEAYNLIMDWYKQGLDTAGITGTGYNLYQKPQVRKGFVERVDKTLKDPKSLSMAFKDLFTYTDDDMIQGDKSLGPSVKVIPKRFTYQLEDQSDVSDELFYSMNLMVEQAYLRAARVNAYGDIMTVMDSVENENRYNKIDKAAQASQSYKMVKSAIDQGLFDISETVTYEVTIPFINKKVDLTKTIKNMINFVKMRNLALNPIIAATSALTGEITRKIEAAVGEFIEPRSQKLGTKEFRNIVGDGAKEFGKINSKAKINVLGQIFGAFNMQETFKNSNYGFMARLAPKLGMGMHTMANYSLYGKTMLGVLHDFRVVDGRLTNWYNYKQQELTKGKNLKDVKGTWRSYEGKVAYSYMDVANGIFSLDTNKLSQEINDFNEKDFLDVIKGHIKAVNERTDGQMGEDDRSLANRHYMLSMLTTHRGWLANAMMARFASKAENFNTGKMQSGSYMSLGLYIKDLADTIKKEGFSNIIKSFKIAYDNSDQVDKDNLKRVGIEFAALQAILLLYLGLSGFGDDEDDPFAAKMAVLLANRVSNEIGSVQGYGLGTSIIDVIATPFIGLDVLNNVSKVSDLTSGDIIERGKYKGYTSRQKYIIQNIPGLKTGIIDMARLSEANKTYTYYNEGTRNNALNPLYYFASKFMEDDKK